MPELSHRREVDYISQNGTVRVYPMWQRIKILVDDNMKCPKCGHEFKDPGRVKGGQISKRKLTKTQARGYNKPILTLRKEIFKMEKKVLYTISIMIDGFEVRLTQKIIPRFNFGHYNWIIQDKKGNIMSAGTSWGGPPTRVDKSFLEEKYKEWKRYHDDEYAEEK